MRVQDEQVTFNLFQSMKFPSEVDECSALSLMDSLISKQFEKCCENQLQFEWQENSMLEDKNEK